MSSDEVSSPDISASPAWNALVRHHDEIGKRHLREFFDEDPDRGRELALTVGDLYVDYSKHRITRDTLKLLVDLAKAADLEAKRDAMFAGVHINTSEDRAVLHTALRLPKGAELTVDGQDVVHQKAIRGCDIAKLPDRQVIPHDRCEVLRNAQGAMF